MKYRIKLLKKTLNLFPREEIVLGFLLLWLVGFICFVVVFVLGFVWFGFLFLKYDARDLIFMFFIRCFMEKHSVKVKKRKLSMTLLIRQGANFKSNVNRLG